MAAMRGGTGWQDGALLDDRYVLGRRLGRGGMTRVYLASDQQSGDPVIVKVPHGALVRQQGFKRRFKQGIQELLALQHRHLVRVRDQGVHQGTPYAVTAYMSGGSLAEAMAQRGRQHPSDVARWLTGVASALALVEERDAVHQEVKPANILFDQAGNACVSDFGVSLAADVQSLLSEEGLLLGDPVYMAPEQCVAEPVVGRTDQYCLAAIAYRALAGRPPLEGETTAALLRNKQELTPAPVYKFVPRLWPSSGAAVMRALKRDPQERFASCLEFAEAFQQGVSRMVAPGAPTPSVAPAAPPSQAQRVRVDAARTEESAVQPAPEQAAAPPRPARSARPPSDDDTLPAPGRPAQPTHRRTSARGAREPVAVDRPVQTRARKPGAGWLLRPLWSAVVFVAVAVAAAFVLKGALAGATASPAPWAERLDQVVRAGRGGDWARAHDLLGIARRSDGATWVDVRVHEGMTVEIYRRLRREAGD